MKLVSEHNKLSLTECKKILNTDGLYYTDAEVIELRDFLYHMADIVMDDLENEKKEDKKGIRVLRAHLETDIKIIDTGIESKTGSIRIMLFIIKTEHEKQSHHIYPRFD